MEATTPTPMTKIEHQYEMNAHKQDLLIDKLETKLKTTEQNQLELTNKYNALQTENKKLLDENEKAKAECKETVETCQFHIDSIEEQNDELEKEIEALKTESKNAAERYQKQHNEIIGSNEELTKQVDSLKTENKNVVGQYQTQIDELKTKILPAEEMNYYYGCKADTIMQDAFNNGVLILTPDYLKTKNFPAALLMAKDFDGITTTNFSMTKGKNEKNFTLTKN